MGEAYVSKAMTILVDGVEVAVEVTCDREAIARFARRQRATGDRTSTTFLDAFGVKVVLRDEFWRKG